MPVELRNLVSLTHTERGILLADLDSIAGYITRIDELLEVAAARSGTSVSAWTEARLDALSEQTRLLWEKVNHAPLNGD